MRFAFLAVLAGVLSCQTATQITVKLRGVGVECPSGSEPTIEQTGVLAKPKLQSPADMSELSVLGEECAAAEQSVVSLGDIVLVPADGPGPVEVLALGALKVGEGPAVSAEECRAEYERLFGSPCEIGENKACESCIFARRSVAFVKHSKLEITIDLDASCAGVVCDPSQTCSKGECVSAEATCEDDGSCTLVNQNQGGGGSGAGGAGGAGGTGGDGGGGAPGVWTTLWEPGDSNCSDADPSDVIGGLIDTEAGPRFHALVPAGPCMLVLEEGEPPAEYVAAQNTTDNDYRAVAKGNDGDFITLGDRGVARWSSAPPFSVLDSPASFNDTMTGIAWDVAAYGASDVAWTRSYQAEPPQVVPFIAAAPSGFVGAALFAVFPSESPTETITFAAWASSVGARRVTTQTPEPVGPSPQGWSIWAEELASDPGQFQVVAVGASTGAVHAGRCSDSPTAGPDCDFGAEAVYKVPSAQDPRKVVAIWGLQTADGFTLYAVGEDGENPAWLGRTTLPAMMGSTVSWTFAELPSQIVPGNVPAIKSVWVGPDGDNGPSVVVVGPAGVFKAELHRFSISSQSRDRLRILGHRAGLPV